MLKENEMNANELNEVENELSNVESTNEVTNTENVADEIIEEKAKKKKSSQETGIAINVGNFEEIIILLKELGPDYDPGAPELAIAILEQQLIDNTLNLGEVQVKDALNDKATNLKAEMFEPLQKYSTRLFNSLKSFRVNDKTIADAEAINRLVQGKRATKVKDTIDKDGKVVPENSISVSHLSYTNMIQHFGAWHELLVNVTKYNPKKDDLKPAHILILIDELKLKKVDALSTKAGLSTARNTRNVGQYDDKIGLIATTDAIKSELKASIGGDDARVKKILGISFKKRKL